MKKRNIFLISLMFILFLFMKVCKAVGTTETKEQEIEQETENLLKVAQKFAELMSINKLPVIKANDTRGRATFYKIKDDRRKKPWMSEDMSIDLEGCSDLYMAEVESERGKLKYFFCIENSIIKLISTYMQHDEKWIKKEE